MPYQIIRIKTGNEWKKEKIIGFENELIASPDTRINETEKY
ncbi:MAG: hypothetical protein ACYC2P_10335 [Paludibacteraceae bacterium]